MKALAALRSWRKFASQVVFMLLDWRCLTTRFCDQTFDRVTFEHFLGGLKRNHRI